MVLVELERVELERVVLLVLAIFTVRLGGKLNCGRDETWREIELWERFWLKEKKMSTVK
jgi:hypothetical protein